MSESESAAPEGHWDWRTSTRELTDAWSMTRFSAQALSNYARGVVLDDTRNGLTRMSLMALLLLAGEVFTFARLGLPQPYFYTCGLLALLAFHVYLSAGAVNEVRSLYLLGTSMIVINAMALVLLAHQSGELHMALFGATALLFMIVPIMPWGLGAGATTVLLIYGVFTVSTASMTGRFDTESLLTLQFVLIGAGVASVVLIARNAGVRKRDIRTRFELEQTNDDMRLLSNLDPLTGAWNRRYLKEGFAGKTEAWRAAERTYQFAFVDVDDFKSINDTFGHDVGDEVLKWLVAALRDRIGDDGCLVRMGGDEFAVLFESGDPEKLIDDAFESVWARARAHRDLAEFRLGLSIGMISVPPRSGTTQTRLLKLADLALYDAKRQKAARPGGVHLVRRPWPTGPDNEADEPASTARGT